jgi:hypothetical protein
MIVTSKDIEEQVDKINNEYDQLKMMLTLQNNHESDIMKKAASCLLESQEEVKYLRTILNKHGIQWEPFKYKGEKK